LLVFTSFKVIINKKIKSWFFDFCPRGRALCVPKYESRFSFAFNNKLPWLYLSIKASN